MMLDERDPLLKAMDHAAIEKEIERRIKNYEASYTRMWDEIRHARQEREHFQKLLDNARDLILALQDDVAEGTKVSFRTHTAFLHLQNHFNLSQS